MPMSRVASTPRHPTCTEPTGAEPTGAEPTFTERGTRMSTRSYVGVLDVNPDTDARTYRVRYVHFDGGPDTMPYLIAAVWWHTFGRHGTATVQALLAHD